MIGVVVRRILQAIPTLLGVSLVIFILVRLTGDPVNLLVPPSLDLEARAAIRHNLGLDKPAVIQYLLFLKNALTGDLGVSVRNALPVTSLVAQRFVATLELTLSAMALSTLIGLPLGLWAGLRQGGWVDRLCRGIAYVGQSLPVFYTGLILIIIFAVKLRVFPAVYNGQADSLVLPMAALSFAILPLILRISRASVVDVSAQEYIRTARSKGASERRIVAVHMLRNAAIPIVTILGLQFGMALGGAVVTETVFAWPGLGRLLVDAVSARDYGVVQGAVLFVATVFVFTNLAVDLLCMRIDPAIRLK
jgi:ABC-type dipeptide/oligopeptide/nickel transport system permease component